MRATLIDMALDRLPHRDADVKKEPKLKDPLSIIRVPDKTLAYSERHRNQFYYPEYDFDEIQIAQDADGYMSRSILKKVNRIILAGWSLVGADDEAVKYITQRLNEMAWATNKPTDHVIFSIFYDLFRFNNHVLVKVRDLAASSGKVRTDPEGTELEPVAGYFPIAFETLQFKSKPNGDLKKIMQKMPTGKYKEFFPEDIVHFFTNRKPGFSVGTPELLPALDDIAVLRRIEENVEDLIESNLFPVFHYKVGNDEYPVRYTPDGTSELDLVKATVEYMPSGGVYVSDHRQEVTTIGSEGEALRIDYYIQHFKNRVFASLGTSALDMGEGAGANRSTASTLSKGMLMDIEATALQVKAFIDFYIISELLIEGGFNPFDPDEKVEIRFGVIDKEERRADENQQIQLFTNNLRTMDEVRASLGDKPFTEEMMDRTFQKMFAEPLAMLKGVQPGSAAGETLATHPASNLTPEAVNKEKQFAKEQEKAKAKAKAMGAKPGAKKKSASSTAKARPKNQHGTRSSTKTTRDEKLLDISLPDGTSLTVACEGEFDDVTLSDWTDALYRKYQSMKDTNVSLETIAQTMLWRLKEPK
jgi:hypothetical protein